MQLQTRYITLDDFKNYFQIDLVQQLGGEVPALGFLKRIEDRMESFINANFFRVINDAYVKFNDFQKEHYKLALLEQAIYIFRNGDISVDSGYDPEQGIKVKRSELHQLVISDNSRMHLIQCGIWNRHIGPAGFFGFW